jgi:hypothetical protein
MKPKCITIAVATALLAACTSLPVYDAPFADIDRNSDGVIEWYEFKARYPEADPKAFLEADRNKNGEITTEEWQSFVVD